MFAGMLVNVVMLEKKPLHIAAKVHNSYSAIVFYFFSSYRFFTTINPRERAFPFWVIYISRNFYMQTLFSAIRQQKVKCRFASKKLSFIALRPYFVFKHLFRGCYVKWCFSHHLGWRRDPVGPFIMYAEYQHSFSS